MNSQDFERLQVNAGDILDIIERGGRFESASREEYVGHSPYTIQTVRRALVNRGGVEMRSFLRGQLCERSWRDIGGITIHQRAATAAGEP